MTSTTDRATDRVTEAVLGPEEFAPRGPGKSSNEHPEHGTPAGYRRLHPDGERCTDCKRAWAQYRAGQRGQDKATGRQPQRRAPAACGTRGGYNRHVRDVQARKAAGEVDARVDCVPCLEAYNQEQSEQHARREDLRRPDRARQPDRTRTPDVTLHRRQPSVLGPAARPA